MGIQVGIYVNGLLVSSLSLVRQTDNPGRDAVQTYSGDLSGQGWKEELSVDVPNDLDEKKQAFLFVRDVLNAIPLDEIVPRNEAQAKEELIARVAASFKTVIAEEASKPKKPSFEKRYKKSFVRK